MKKVLTAIALVGMLTAGATVVSANTMIMSSGGNEAFQNAAYYMGAPCPTATVEAVAVAAPCAVEPPCVTEPAPVEVCKTTCEPQCPCTAMAWPMKPVCTPCNGQSCCPEVLGFLQRRIGVQ